MAPMLLAILLLLLIAGIFLTVLGIRGRRINDHPVCRWCHFDLQGVYPEVITCPECGAGLKREGTVRIGARRKMPILAVLGIFLCLTSFVPVGVVAYALLTGSDLNKFKPLGLLLWESRHAGQRQSAQIAAELMDRSLKKSLDPSQYDAVIEASLARQADLSLPWAEEWGDLIDRAKFDGVLKPAQEARYFEHAGVFELKTRAATFPGAKLPVLLQVKETRVGANTSVSVPLFLKSAAIGSSPLKHIVTSEDSWFGTVNNIQQRSLASSIFSRGFPGSATPNSPSPDGYLDSFTLSGSRARSPAAPRQAMLFEVPPNTQTGQQTLSLAVEMRPSESQGFGGFVVINGTIRTQNQDSGRPVNATFNADLVMKPSSADICSPIAPTPDVTSAIEKQLLPQHVTLQRDLLSPFNADPADGTDPLVPKLTLNLDVKDLPQPVAFRVFARDPQNPTREIELGSVASGTDPTATTSPLKSFGSTTSISISINGLTTSSSSSSSSSDHTVSAPAPDWLDSAVDIVLRPDPAAAERTIDQDQFYNKEFIFKSVSVTKDIAPVIGDPFNSLLRRPAPRAAPPAKKRKTSF